MSVKPGPVPSKIVRYAEGVIRKYDSNGNGILDEPEWRSVSGNPHEADLNHDGAITPEELVVRIVVYGRHRSLRLLPPGAQDAANLKSQPRGGDAGQPVIVGPDGNAMTPANALTVGDARTRDQSAAGIEPDAASEQAREQARRSRKFFIPRDKLPAGLASWFIDRDADGDGQITMREFSVKWSAEVGAQFQAYDHNRDGVITAAESVRGVAKPAANDPATAAAATPVAPSTLSQP